MNKGLNLKARNAILRVVLVTFTVPPAAIIVMGIVNGIIPFEKMIILVRHWALYLFILPFVVLVPLSISRKLQHLEKNIDSWSIARIFKFYKSIHLTYFISAMVFGLTAIPISYLSGFTPEEVKLVSIFSLFYLCLANIPSFVKWIQFVDIYFAEIELPKILPIFTVRNKFILTSMISSLGALGILVVSFYSLFWRFLYYPEMNITESDILYRLIILGVIIYVGQVLPNLFNGLFYSKTLSILNSSIRSLARKNLQSSKKSRSKDELGDIYTNLNVMTSNFREVITELRENSDFLNTTGRELNKMSEEFSNNSSQLAASSEEISASLEQVTASITANSENSQKSGSINREAEESLQEGKELVTGTLGHIRKITDKIKVIEEIAGQTNLLAINAFIEAANAGDSGTGFSVVAKEVRSLADLSREAAEEIRSLSADSLNSSSNSKEMIDRIYDIVAETASMSSDIAQSSIEQLKSTEQINGAVQEFNSLSQALASTAEELASTAHESSQRSGGMAKILNEFQL